MAEALIIRALSAKIRHKSKHIIDKKTDIANAMPAIKSKSEFLEAQEQEGAKVFASLRELNSVVFLRNVITLLSFLPYKIIKI